MAATRMRPRPRGTDLFPSPPPWAAQGLCADAGRSDDWFPDETDTEAVKAAAAVCEQCPVRTACLEAAMSTRGLEQGIWGGTTRAQRKALLRNRTRAARAARTATAA